MKPVKKTKRRSRKNSTTPQFQTQMYAAMCDTRDLDKELLTLIGF